MAHAGRQKEVERIARRDVYRPEAPAAEPDDERVQQLLRLYPDHDAQRWVQSMVGWRRKAAEYKQRALDAERRGEELLKAGNRVVASLQRLDELLDRQTPHDDWAGDFADALSERSDSCNAWAALAQHDQGGSDSAEKLSQEEWDRQYDEAMQWRDWGTCEYLMTVKPDQPENPDA